MGIFLLLPTLVFCYFLLWNANQYYSILNDQSLRQTLFIGMGMLASGILYSFRIRFLPSFVLLLLLLYLIYKNIDRISSQEFDTFFRSVQFLVFSFTFSFGWLLAWGFVRVKYWAVLVSGFFLSVCLWLLAKQNAVFLSLDQESQFRDYLLILGPVAIYGVYLIFTANQIRQRPLERPGEWGKLLGRVLLFALLAGTLLTAVLYVQRQNIEATLNTFGGGAQEGKNSMLEKDQQNRFNLKDYTRLRGSLGRSNELLFAAHIDNYFPDGSTPNPLYLTAFYYARFDTITETFEKDSLMPDQDLFEPDPSAIPLFTTKTDSSVLHYALREKFRKTVEIEVYKKQLSAETFLAPSTAFFVQPITVEKDFRQEFYAAFRAKSYVSELNSAYFVYNDDNPQLRQFQEQRFEVLRGVRDYAGVDKALMRYYTDMPQGPKFDSIRDLAGKITTGLELPIDKILAIRDYFLSDDEQGEPLFSYTDNPGVPDIPSASKLNYFLFHNRKGYCAYYAGATLFMLRALGIPSRITAGFLTMDRSSRNKGWYWYYADQAHAWVQVYFPGYGWLDFDTTIGNEDARESPQPDGTPPMQPPKAYLVLTGRLSDPDTVRKTASAQSRKLLFHDQEYPFAEARRFSLDLSQAQIRKDSVELALSALEDGDSATVVSYARALKDIRFNRDGSTEANLSMLPNPLPIDEVYLHKQQAEPPDPPAVQKAGPDERSWTRGLLMALALLVVAFIIYLFIPLLIRAYLRLRYNRSRSYGSRAYYGYQLSLFVLHQQGFPRKSLAPLEYGAQIDQQFATRFKSFIRVFQKLKYAPGAVLIPYEQALIGDFLPELLQQLRQDLPFKTRLRNAFRPLRSLQFYFPRKSGA